MKLDKLLIEKSIYPLDWNPTDPNGYNEWMKMISDANRKSSIKISESTNTVQGFVKPEPRFISEIIRESLIDDLLGMNHSLYKAQLILKGVKP